MDELFACGGHYYGKNYCNEARYRGDNIITLGSELIISANRKSAGGDDEQKHEPDSFTGGLFICLAGWI
jgi:hypothetical protein